MLRRELTLAERQASIELSCRTARPNLRASPNNARDQAVIGSGHEPCAELGLGQTTSPLLRENLPVGNRQRHVDRSPPGRSPSEIPARCAASEKAMSSPCWVKSLVPTTDGVDDGSSTAKWMRSRRSGSHDPRRADRESGKARLPRPPRCVLYRREPPTDNVGGRKCSHHLRDPMSVDLVVGTTEEEQLAERRADRHVAGTCRGTAPGILEIGRPALDGPTTTRQRPSFGRCRRSRRRQPRTTRPRSATPAPTTGDRSSRSAWSPMSTTLMRTEVSPPTTGTNVASERHDGQLPRRGLARGL